MRLKLSSEMKKTLKCWYNLKWVCEKKGKVLLKMPHLFVDNNDDVYQDFWWRGFVIPEQSNDLYKKNFNVTSKSKCKHFSWKISYLWCEKDESIKKLRISSYPYRTPYTT